MQDKKFEFGVGVLMLAGILAMAFLAIQVSSRNNAEGNNSYTITAYFNNVSGLTEKAKVSLAGVTIGRVQKIEIVPATLQAKVTMQINRDINYLSSDSSAVIQTAGILGEKYIGLYPGSQDETLTDDSKIYDTQSSLILEDLIGKLVTNIAAKN